MSACTVHITFTKSEFVFLSKKAALKNKTLWGLMQIEVSKAFEGFEVKEGVGCEGETERVCKVFSFPDRMWRSIVCLSKQMGLTPSQLVYRLVVAPYLGEIMKEKALAAKAKVSD